MITGSIPAYFRPPPETFSMFDDLADDDDESSEEIEPPHPSFPAAILSQGRLQSRLLVRPSPVPLQASRVRRQQRPSRPAPTANPVVNRPRVSLPEQIRSAYQPPVRPPVAPPPSYARLLEPVRRFYADKEAKKRSDQAQRLDKAEEDIKKYLDEFPDDAKLKAKQLQIQKYGDNLKNGKLLSSAETSFVYDVVRSIERRRVTIETKSFAEQLKPPSSGERFHKKQPRTSPTPSFSHPTTGGKAINNELLSEGQPSKRRKLAERPAALDLPEEILEHKQEDGADDVNDSDSDSETELDARPHYGGKSVTSTQAYSFTSSVELNPQNKKKYSFEDSGDADGQTDISESGDFDTPATDATAMEDHSLDVNDRVPQAHNDVVKIGEDDERDGHWQYTVVQYDHRNYTPASDVSHTIGTFTDRDEAVAAIDHRIQDLAENRMWQDAEVRNVTNEADELWARDIHSDAVGSVEIRIQKNWIVMSKGDDDQGDDHDVCRRTWSGKGTRQPREEPQHTYVIWMEQKNMTSGTIIKCDVGTKSYSDLGDANRHAARLWQLESMSEKEAPPEDVGEVLESPTSFGPGFLGDVEIGDDFFHKHFLVYKGDDLVQITISVRMLEVNH